MPRDPAGSRGWEECLPKTGLGFRSNYDYFGSGVVVRGMGFALQNRGALFALDANDPDALGPHKRPFHTIIPAFRERGASISASELWGLESTAGARAIRIQHGRL